jgi:hypothetical protein
LFTTPLLYKQKELRDRRGYLTNLGASKIDRLVPCFPYECLRGCFWFCFVFFKELKSTNLPHMTTALVVIEISRDGERLQVDQIPPPSIAFKLMQDKEAHYIQAVHCSVEKEPEVPLVDCHD